MGSEPGFSTIVIVGVGLIGGSFGLAVRRKHPGVRIIGVSSRVAVQNAIALGAITEGCGYEELSEAVRQADLVVLCTPIHRIQGLLTLIRDAVRPGVLVTDVGSTKRLITRHAREVLPAGVHFIGGHPMAGSEKSGVDAADPFLFQNAIYVLTPTEGTPDTVLRRFSDLVTDLGARVVIMDAERHDRVAATVSHLPQMLAVALVTMAGSSGDDAAACLQLGAGGFRDMTRIASSPFTMWDDICRTNEDLIKAAVDTFIARLTVLRDRIGAQALGEEFEVANHIRGSIPKDTKGFLRTLSEVLVVVEDQPGVIATIATALADRGINIKDIEVMKVREGEGGTLRLAFEREDEAHRAVDILAASGITARFRS